MKVYRPLDYGKNVMCACKDETCFKCVSFGPNNLIFESDISDPQGSETFVIDLPENITLAETVEVEPHISNDQLVELAKQAADALGPEEGRLAHKVFAASMLALRDIYEERLNALRVEVESRTEFNRLLQDNLGKLTKEKMELQRKVGVLSSEKDRLLIDLNKAKKGVR